MTKSSLLPSVIREAIVRTQDRLDQAKDSLRQAAADEKQYRQEMEYAILRQVMRKKDVDKLEEELTELIQMLEESDG